MVIGKSTEEYGRGAIQKISKGEREESRPILKVAYIQLNKTIRSG
jgi:hypothetical protein